ncbi:MAG: hypothetical protein KKI08_00835, partial [Armatimonadetes bacterium]|nr:hypothetical protein [Armatimonadota bacterium]
INETEPAGVPSVESAVGRLLQAGLSVRDVAGVLADLGLAARREAYQLALAMKEERAERGENREATDEP